MNREMVRRHGYLNRLATIAAFLLLALALYWFSPFVMASWFILSANWLYASVGALSQLFGASRLILIGTLIATFCFCRWRLSLSGILASAIIGWLFCGVSLVTDLMMLARWPDDAKGLGGLQEAFEFDEPEVPLRRLLMPLGIEPSIQWPEFIQLSPAEPLRYSSGDLLLAWVCLAALIIGTWFLTKVFWKRLVDKNLKVKARVDCWAKVAVVSFGLTIYGHLEQGGTIIRLGTDGFILYTLVVLLSGVASVTMVAAGALIIAKSRREIEQAMPDKRDFVGGKRGC